MEKGIVEKSSACRSARSIHSVEVVTHSNHIHIGWPLAQGFPTQWCNGNLLRNQKLRNSQCLSRHRQMQRTSSLLKHLDKCKSLNISCSESGRANGHADARGLRDRESRARARRKPEPTGRPHQVEGEGERGRVGASVAPTGRAWLSARTSERVAS